MAIRVNVIHAVLFAGPLILSLALGDGSTCAADSAGCIKSAPPIGDDDGVHPSKVSLLQTKLDFQTDAGEDLRPEAGEGGHAKVGNRKAQAGERMDSNVSAQMVANFTRHFNHILQNKIDKDRAGQKMNSTEKTTGPGCLYCLQAFEYSVNQQMKTFLCNERKNGWKMDWPCHVCKEELTSSCEAVAELTLLPYFPYFVPPLPGQDRPGPPPPPGPYQPGEPGGPWTLHEVLAVKGKLWRLMAAHQGEKLWKSLPATRTDLATMSAWRDLDRIAPKLLRLGFHDCFRYKDGSGGCDGCLEWEGVGKRYTQSKAGQRLYNADDTLSHNNGLGPTVEFLEQIYSKTDWPPKTQMLEKPLMDTGKSRADLWALATIASVEHGIQMNNGVCQDPQYEAKFLGIRGLTFSSTPHCHHLAGKPECDVKLPKPFKFAYGRKDCGFDYRTSAAEVHPDAMGDGKATAKYFREQFGFAGKDTVAILGAHTMGRPHYQNSMLRYNWVKNGDQMFNNQYYRTTVGKQDWRFILDSCDYVGSARETPPVQRWLARAQNDMVNGGPIQFVLEQKTCPDSCGNPVSARDDRKCINTRGCHDDIELWRAGTEGFEDNTVETRFPAEMGLYLDFTRGTDGMPTGCAGLARFTSEQFKINASYRWSGTGDDTNFVKGATECGKQGYAVPAESKSLSELVEEYAENQEAWVKDFGEALEKMLSNGYSSDQLSKGPDQWTHVRCPPQFKRKESNQFWFCYSRERVSMPFMIKSMKDGRVISEASDDSGDLELWPSNGPKPNDLRQVWYATGSGTTGGAFTGLWVNGKTFGAMVIEGIPEFQWSSGKKHALVIRDRYKDVFNNLKGNSANEVKEPALTVEFRDLKGHLVLREANGTEWQQWQMVELSSSDVELLPK